MRLTKFQFLLRLFVCAKDWAAIDRMGNYGVNYTLMKIRNWTVKIDTRLLESDKATTVKNTMAVDLQRAYKSMPPVTRDHVRYVQA